MRGLMRASDDITVYNKYIVSRAEAYIRTTVLYVAWQGYDAAKKLIGGGQMSDDKAAVYIPSQNRPAYLDPKEWTALADKSANWTLKNGDVIVKGVIPEEITALFTITDLMAKYNDVLVVTFVNHHDYGAPNMQHFKVMAK